MFEQNCLSVSLVSELWKTADWTWMTFGVVSGVGRRMGVLDGMDIVEGKGTVLGVGLNVGHPIVTSGDFVA